jgi:hypothetical protein
VPWIGSPLTPALSPREREKRKALFAAQVRLARSKNRTSGSLSPGEREKSRTHFASQETFSEEQKPHERFPLPLERERKAERILLHRKRLARSKNRTSGSLSPGEREKSRTYFATQETFSEE